jgi:putative protein kinase ArgK-like GTPase of G3E family
VEQYGEPAAKRGKGAAPPLNIGLLGRPGAGKSALVGD